MEQKQIENLIREAEERLKDWQFRAGTWYMTYYVLGIVSTILLVTGASKPPFLSTDQVSVVIWMAAITQGLNTFLISMQKASSYRAAWRHLKFALIDFKTSPITNPSDREPSNRLKQSIKEGWQQIDNGYSSDTE